MAQPLIRRSPLHAVHAGLSARWVSAEAWWPADYGAPEREARLIRDGAGLVDWGPLDKYAVKGTGVTAAIACFGPAPRGGELAVYRYPRDRAGEAEVWGLPSGEALVLLSPAMPGAATELRTAAAAGGAGVFDLSSGLAALRIAGPSSGRVLEELCAVDLDERAMPDRSVVQAPVANIHATIGRRDVAGVRVYTLLVARDLVEYAWDALLHAGRAYSLAPAGTQAIKTLG